MGKTTYALAAGEKKNHLETELPGLGLGVRRKNPCEQEPLLLFMHVPRTYGLAETRVLHVLGSAPQQHQTPSAVLFGGIY